MIEGVLYFTAEKIPAIRTDPVILDAKVEFECKLNVQGALSARNQQIQFAEGSSFIGNLLVGDERNF